MAQNNLSSKEFAEPMTALPIPQQVPAHESMAAILGAKLGYWDTGGAGEPIMLLHPASGSALVWLYQQPVFAQAGYRVIAYSRRNYYNSDSAPADNPGTASGDLEALVNFLGLEKLHIVSSAAGGSVAADYALSYPQRLLSLTVSSNNLAAAQGYIADAAARMKLDAWDELPRWYRELGPSYRAINPEGVAKWTEINEISETGRGARQKLVNVVTPEKLEDLRVPTLLMTGSADMFTPPSVQRLIARHIPDSELMVAPECGHSIYWERPDLFNRTVLDFIGRHGMR
jgi:pimeloyl-ACP methyl ester carboxylesterase